MLLYLFYDEESVKFSTHYFLPFKTNFIFKANDGVTALAPRHVFYSHKARFFNHRWPKLTV